MAKVNTTHDDFGEKIGGAKKDLWRSRGLEVADLLEMNEREMRQYVKKDNIWKRDYDKFLKNDVPAEVVYFMKTIRDSIPPKPLFKRSDDTPELKLARQKQYVETIREIQGIVESCTTEEDARGAFNKILDDGGYYEDAGAYGGSHWRKTDKGKDNPVVDSKLFKALAGAKSSWRWNIAREAEKAQFGVSKEDKIPKGFEVHFYSKEDDKNSFTKGKNHEPDTYWISQKRVFGNVIIAENIPTREEAVRLCQEHAEIGKKGKSRKRKFTPPQFENIEREGDDYRNGLNIDGQDYIETFGFKGGEFGNWLNQNERQLSLNHGYDALKDLAKALQISEKDVAFNGELSIAFGARGSGNALAHYEPMRKVINLTKMKGAGSLAHEWWHGFDDFLGKHFGYENALSKIERSGIKTELSTLIDTLKYAPKDDDKPFRTPTEFYQNSSKMDRCTSKEGGYWQSNEEMTARAFACYLADKIGVKSDYLVGHADCAVGIDTDGNAIIAFPQGDERTAINAAFDGLFERLKELEIVRHTVYETPEIQEKVADLQPKVESQESQEKVAELQPEKSNPLTELTDKLERGIKDLCDSERYKSYLDTMSKFHTYSLNNTMLIALQSPNASHVAGFNAWKTKFERSVNKGEKGIKILAPVVKKIKKKVPKINEDTGLPVLDKNGEPVLEEVVDKITNFKAVTVFDVSQTSGKELPEVAKNLQGEVGNYSAFMQALEQISPVPMEFKPLPKDTNGYFDKENREIAINENMSQSQTIKTAIHEIAHALLHDDCDGKSKQTREVEAESVAYVVCQKYGIDTSSYSFGYIATWGAGRDIKSSLETIKTAASEMITAIDEKIKVSELTKEVATQSTEKVATVQPTKKVAHSESEQPPETPKKHFKLNSDLADKVAVLLEEKGVEVGRKVDGNFTTLTVEMTFASEVINLTKAVMAQPQKEAEKAAESPKQEVAEPPKNAVVIGNKQHFKVEANYVAKLQQELRKLDVKFECKPSGKMAVFTIAESDVATYNQARKNIGKKPSLLGNLHVKKQAAVAENAARNAPEKGANLEHE